jgi:hypothetical protein
MALGALTLSVETGQRGRPFEATISGATAGSTIEPVVNFTPGFYVSGAKLKHDHLPLDLNTVVLRETLVGNTPVETKFQIPGYSADNPEQAALTATQAIIEDSVDLVVPVTGSYTDTITPTIVDGEVTAFVLS